jgi:iojap-like protein
MINNFDFYKPALELGKLLEEFKGVNTVVLDLRDAHIWTDFFIITTVTSAAHAGGLEKRIHESLPEYGLEEYHTKRKSPDGDEWKLIDLGGIIIHLMSETARNFYALEKIWYDSKNILE